MQGGRQYQRQGSMRVSDATVGGLRGRWWHAMNVIVKKEAAVVCLQIQRVDALVQGNASAPSPTPPALEQQPARDVWCSS
eukprot:88757-Hanusia_phi.AAC.1